jgi:hypothetical protein
MSLLDEFAQQVLASHGLVVIAIQAGEQPDLETFLELGAEILSVQKLARLQSRNVDSIKDTRQCWQKALECFQASEEIWNRLSVEGELPERHRRLLQRLRTSAADQVNFYDESVSGRRVYR